MAVSSGFGSAFTGFGSGYLNALRQGQSERSNLINAKIKREEITRKGLEDKSNNEFRNLQKAYMLQNQEASTKFRTDQAQTSKDKLRNQTIYNATRLMTAHMPRLNSITDPLQAEAERAAVRNSVGSILSTSGHFKPEEIDSIAQSWLPSIGSEVQGSRRTVNRLGDIDPTKTKDINYADALKQFGSLQPGRNTVPMQGPDGLPMAQDINVTPRDTYAVTAAGAGNFADKAPGPIAPTNDFLQMAADPSGLSGFNKFMQGPRDARGNVDFQGQARPEQRFDATSTPRAMYQEQVPVTARTGLSDVDQSKVALSNATTAGTLQRTELARKAFPLEMQKIGAYIDTAYAGIENIGVQNRFKEKELNFRVIQLQTQSDLTRAGQAIQRVANDIASKRLSVSEGQLQLARTLRPQEVMSGLDRTITIAKQFLTEKVTALGGKKETQDMKSLREQINGMVTARSKLNTFSTQNSTNPKAWQDIAEAVLRSADLNNTLPNGTKLVDPKTGQRIPEGPQRTQLIGNAIEQRGTALPFNPQNPLYRGGYENLPGTFGPNMNPDYYYGGDDMDYAGAFGQSQLPATGGAGGPFDRFFNFNDDGSY
jgi:hypothetical protein